MDLAIDAETCAVEGRAACRQPCPRGPGEAFGHFEVVAAGKAVGNALMVVAQGVQAKAPVLQHGAVHAGLAVQANQNARGLVTDRAGGRNRCSLLPARTVGGDHMNGRRDPAHGLAEALRVERQPALL